MPKQAHTVRVVMPQDHRLELELPSDFPAGQADVTVVSEEGAETVPRPTGSEQAEEFERWLRALLSQLPRAPVLPLEAFDRESIYGE